MTFLNPLLLIGLAAAAIPIILHLLNLRKLRTVEFSSLQFLKELQKTKMRRIKIKQWLLLALRTLLIIALVMAFSRPALRGSLASTIGTHAKTTTVILLDDSPSMSLRNERGIQFHQATDAVAQILDLMKEGDDAYLIKLSDIRHTEHYTAGHSPDLLKDALHRMTPSYETVPYRMGFGVAAKLLAVSQNFNQEVYLITDAQGTQFTISADDTARLFSDRARIFVIDVNNEKTKVANSALTGIEIQSQIITQGKPVSLKATVHNYASAALKDDVLSAYLDGERLVQESMDIQGNGSAVAALAITPKRRGFVDGYLQLEDDAMEIDNRWYFVLDVPQSVNMLAVGASADELRFPVLALSLDKDSATAGLFHIHEISEPQLSSMDVNQYDALLLSGLKDFSQADVERIVHFVQGGGGLILFPGPETDVSNYNTTLFPKLGIPPVQIFETSTGSQEGNRFLSFGSTDFDHPIFSGLFEEQIGRTQRTLESPKIYKTLLEQPGQRGHVIIGLSNGAGFLTEFPTGAGRVLVFGVEAGLTWSDFPVKGVFVPLLYRSAIYLASRSEQLPSFTVGHEIAFSLRVRNQSGTDIFVLVSPSGIEERIIPRFLGASGLATVRGENSAEPGIYKLRRKQAAGKKEGGELLQTVAVNIDPAESDLRSANRKALEAFWQSIGIREDRVRYLASPEKIDTAILQSRFGVELWKYLVGFAIILALAEMAVGRESKRTSEREERT